MKSSFLRVFVPLAAAVLLCGSLSGAKPIRTLIVTGQNNHNWQVSHVVLKQILENAGLFEVDLAVSPPQGGDMSVFQPDFGAYQLVVLDYNGDRWPARTDERFLEYARNGGGILIYHAADNAFADWPEFNRIIALGGWGGRTGKDGPYVYLHDGSLVRDDSPGAGGSHGPQHEYALHAHAPKHPVVKGLPDTWLHARDELYDRMRGPGNIGDVLYSAYSDTAKGGSGREEVLIFTVDYGKARIFHTMLGHAAKTAEESTAMQCAGFQVTLLRGAEWAATGKVTQKVPDDFPTATRTSMRKDFLDPAQK